MLGQISGQDSLKKTTTKEPFRLGWGENGICEKHNANVVLVESNNFGSKEDPWVREQYECPKCEEERKIKELEDKKQEKLKQGRRIWNDLKIPPRYKSKLMFEDYVVKNDGQKKNILAIKEYLSELHINDCNLIFLGKPGTGKTHLAFIIMSELALLMSIKSEFITLLKLIRNIKETWKKDSEYTEDDVIKAYSKCDFLIIDEIGIQYSSPTELIYLTEIINNRYNEMLPTILIGNCTMSEMSGIVGERIVDRFREGGKVLVFDWESYRGIKKEVL